MGNNITPIIAIPNDIVHSYFDYIYIIHSIIKVNNQFHKFISEFLQIYIYALCIHFYKNVYTINISKIHLPYFPIYRRNSFVPNSPTMLMVPPPSVKDRICEATIQTALPSRGKSSEILEACYILSKAGKDQVKLISICSNP